MTTTQKMDAKMTGKGALVSVTGAEGHEVCNLKTTADGKKEVVSMQMDMAGFDLDTIIDLYKAGKLTVEKYKRTNTDKNGRDDKGNVKETGNIRVGSTMGKVRFTHPKYPHIIMSQSAWINMTFIKEEIARREKAAIDAEIAAKAAQEAADLEALKAKDALKVPGAEIKKEQAAAPVKGQDRLDKLADLFLNDPTSLNAFSQELRDEVMKRILNM